MCTVYQYSIRIQVRAPHHTPTECAVVKISYIKEEYEENNGTISNLQQGRKTIEWQITVNKTKIVKKLGPDITLFEYLFVLLAFGRYLTDLKRLLYLAEKVVGRELYNFVKVNLKCHPQMSWEITKVDVISTYNRFVTPIVLKCLVNISW